MRMKRCPICQALAFEDAQVCYGCLHDYSADAPEDICYVPGTDGREGGDVPDGGGLAAANEVDVVEQLVESVVEGGAPAEEGAHQVDVLAPTDSVEGLTETVISADCALPSFVIRIRPERESSGLASWTCSVDLVPQ